MCMFNVVDFNSWHVYDGASEGSGRSEKVWLISDNNQIGLFKFPKIDPVTQAETTEHISEHLAHQLGELLGVPTANVDLGVYDGRIGSMSYLVSQPGEFLIEGINFISGHYPKYNAETMQNEDDGTYYCIDHILKSVPSFLPDRIWIEMMLFDYLIGNADRHQSNWALLMRLSTENKFTIQLSQCPLYDNGSSLCCYVNDTQISNFLGKDLRRFEVLVDSKSQSIIRIDGTQKKRPKHSDVVKHLLSQYPVAKTIAHHFVSLLNEDNINALLDQYPADILNPSKNILIRRYLIRKLDLLNTFLNTEDSDSVSTK